MNKYKMAITNMILSKCIILLWAWSIQIRNKMGWGLRRPLMGFKGIYFKLMNMRIIKTIESKMNRIYSKTFQEMRSQSMKLIIQIMTS